MAAPATDILPPTRSLSRGSPGVAYWSGQPSYLDSNRDARGQAWFGTPYAYGFVHEALRDPYVRRGEDSVVDPVVAAEWDFAPASDTPLDIEIADFCKHIFLERIQWAQAMSLRMRSYMQTGVAIEEITDDVVDISSTRFPSHPGRGKGIGITGIHLRPTRTIVGWYPGANRERLDHVTQQTPGDSMGGGTQVDLSSDRLLRSTWQPESLGDFLGFAQHRSVYYAVKTKRVLLIVEALRHQREHLGVPVLTLPELQPSEDEVRTAEEILGHLQADERGYLILPNGWKIDLLSTNGSTDIGATLERLNRDIMINYACNWQLLGQQDSNGSFALSSTLEGQYEISLEKHARFQMDTFNLGSDGWSPVERIVRLNYGNTVGLPRLTARNMPTRDWAKILPVLDSLTQSGHITPSVGTETFLRRVLFVPQLDASGARPGPAQDAASTDDPDSEETE